MIRCTKCGAIVQTLNKRRHRCPRKTEKVVDTSWQTNFGYANRYTKRQKI